MAEANKILWRNFSSLKISKFGGKKVNLGKYMFAVSLINAEYPELGGIGYIDDACH